MARLLLVNIEEKDGVFASKDAVLPQGRGFLFFVRTRCPLRMGVFSLVKGGHFPRIGI